NQQRICGQRHLVLCCLWWRHSIPLSFPDERSGILSSRGRAYYANAPVLDAAEIAEPAEAIDDLHLAAPQRLGRLDRSQPQDHAALGRIKPAISQLHDQ